MVVALDPRYKYDYIEFCFNKMYGSAKGKDMLKTLRELVKILFEYYEVEYHVPIVSSSESSRYSTQANTSQCVPESDDDVDWDDAFSLK